MSDVAYSCQVDPGTRLQVRETAGGCAITITNGHGHAQAGVRAADVPAVAREIAIAMHKAAGLRPPIVLERPETHGDATMMGEFRITATAGQVEVDRRPIAPVIARVLAAIIAARADQAEAMTEPRDADVEALAALLCIGPRFDADTSIEIATWLLRHGVRVERDK